MSDEDVIKRRLLIDGDGTGDDRRLNILLKTFIKWCNTTDSQENQIFYDRLMAQLAQCSFVASKSEHTLKMINEELKNYESLSNNIESGIEIAKEDIETCKLNLMYARKVRKNREEYDSLARVINNEPDRANSEKELEALRGELASLQNKSKKLDRKLVTRQNKFKVLMQSIREMELSTLESSTVKPTEDAISKDVVEVMEVIDEDIDLDDIIEYQAVSPQLLE
ncbi:THO complex subunit 7 homolog [Eupeodes corollae]|uniref:THO complex subunit 7 homolog n=1 Tax=Eupeodes corollae TaxID=290404 RepID=UPI00248FC993|nr:THO complex subunit 7 homolog [Eupeodes corollae]